MSLGRLARWSWQGTSMAGGILAIVLGAMALTQGCGASRNRTPNTGNAGGSSGSNGSAGNGSGSGIDQDQDASVVEETDAFVYWPEAGTPVDGPALQDGPSTDAGTLPDASRPDALVLDASLPDAREFIADGVPCNGGTCGADSTFGYRCCRYPNPLKPPYFYGESCSASCGTGTISSLGCDGPEDCGGKACCHKKSSDPLLPGQGDTSCSVSTLCSGGEGMACHSPDDCPKLYPYCCFKTGYTTHVCSRTADGNCN